MAIARDTASTVQSSTTGGTTITYSHTCTGANLVLLVGAVDDNAVPGGSITSITYNGVALTLLTSGTGGGNYGTGYMFGLVNPTTGAHNIVITRTGTNRVMKAASVSYTGVKQTGLPDSFNASVTGSFGTSFSLATTTVAANAIAVLFGSMDNGLYNAGSGSTLLSNTGQDCGMLESSTFPIVSPGSYSMTQVGNTNSWPTMAMVSLAPFIVSPVNGAFLMNFI